MTTSSVGYLPTARYPSHDGKVEAAMLDATLAELVDRGYAGASPRTIADRAGVRLEEVFRRWRSKQHLVLEAINHLAAHQPTPDTGMLRDDLVQVAEAFAGILTHPGTAEVLRSLLVGAGTDTAASVTLRVGLLAERRAVIRRIVERGQRRQQFSSAVHPGLLADAVVGALCYRLLVSCEPVTPRLAVQAVDLVLASHAAGPVPSG